MKNARSLIFVVSIVLVLSLLSGLVLTSSVNPSRADVEEDDPISITQGVVADSIADAANQEIKRAYACVLHRFPTDEEVQRYGMPLVRGEITHADLWYELSRTEEGKERLRSLDPDYIGSVYGGFSSFYGLGDYIEELVRRGIPSDWIFGLLASYDSYWDPKTNTAIFTDFYGNPFFEQGPGAWPVHTPNINPDEVDCFAVWDFVERMYNVFLGRESDYDGKCGWTAMLLDKEINGAAFAKGFAQSPEFQNNLKSMSAEQFVTILYRTFLNR
ncbi:MAG: DUF4214 domain-containing protein, partial [Lachnospiraceae bacterium]|nr:DUF4214 domain-containing protein [Lachnospiraceae bacterium]